MRKRKNRVVVYFNDRELEKLNRMVERTVLSREQFIRDMLAGFLIRGATLCKARREGFCRLLGKRSAWDRSSDRHPNGRDDERSRPVRPVDAHLHPAPGSRHDLRRDCRLIGCQQDVNHTAAAPEDSRLREPVPRLVKQELDLRSDASGGQQLALDPMPEPALDLDYRHSAPPSLGAVLPQMVLRSRSMHASRIARSHSALNIAFSFS